jgi:hypothetical protein
MGCQVGKGILAPGTTTQQGKGDDPKETQEDNDSGKPKGAKG